MDNRLKKSSSNHSQGWIYPSSQSKGGTFYHQISAYIDKMGWQSYSNHQGYKCVLEFGIGNLGNLVRNKSGYNNNEKLVILHWLECWSITKPDMTKLSLYNSECLKNNNTNNNNDNKKQTNKQLANKQTNKNKWKIFCPVVIFNGWSDLYITRDPKQ